MKFEINLQHISFKDITSIFNLKASVAIGPAAQARVESCRLFLDEKMGVEDALFYGINTGFGSLCNVAISPSAIEDLQLNLIRSHACGLGAPQPVEICKLILLLKIINLSWGHSGVRMVLLQRLCDLYNADTIPVLYTFGSLGASGDLAPLAHLSLPLVGEGEVYFGGEIVEASIALKQLNLKPLTLKSKEGLAMINGTQFTTGLTAWSLMQTKHLWHISNMVAAVSCDVFDCRTSPFDDRLSHVRPHEGHRLASEEVRNWRQGSELAEQHKIHVQDPYSFRCVPQVHGASFQAIDHAIHVVTTEINSVTDNPVICPDSDGILSGGNFHAQPIALIADYLAIACSELSSISERRMYQLVCGQRGLADYLIQDAGMNSGFMIAQYTAASLVNRNKILCTPASVDSIVSSKGQEDHVSMGANAASKLCEVVHNSWDVLAIEFLAGMQGLDLRKPIKSSDQIESIHHQFRKIVPMLTEDRMMRPDILSSKAFLQKQLV